MGRYGSHNVLDSLLDFRGQNSGDKAGRFAYPKLKTQNSKLPLICPGDQPQFVVLNQVRMCGDDTHAEPVAPAFRGRNYSAKSISSVVSALFNVQEIHGVRITKCSIVRFTDVRLYSNVCGFYRSEEDPSHNLQFVAHEHGSSTRLRCFYRFDADMWPIDAYTVFPLRQLQGGLAIVCAERLEARRGWFI